MSAGTAKLLRHGRGGSVALAETSWEAAYQVITTDPTDGPATVALAPGIPAFNSVYAIGSELDLGATVSSIVPEQDSEHPQRWTVRVRWSTRNLDPTDPGNTQDPTLRPNVIRWRMEPYTEAVDRDRDGNLIQTANHEWFNPFPETTRYRPVVNIEKNFLTFNDTFMFDYTGAVNSDTWLGGVAEKWLCRELHIDPQFEFGIAYKRVIGEFVYNRNTWSLVLAHKGTLYRPNALTTTPIRTPGGEVVHLTSSGIRTSSHVSDLTFNLHPAQPFQALNLI
jgi:hypothetical protein